MSREACTVAFSLFAGSVVSWCDTHVEDVRVWATVFRYATLLIFWVWSCHSTWSPPSWLAALHLRLFFLFLFRCFSLPGWGLQSWMGGLRSSAPAFWLCWWCNRGDFCSLATGLEVNERLEQKENNRKLLARGWQALTSSASSMPKLYEKEQGTRSPCSKTNDKCQVPGNHPQYGTNRKNIHGVKIQRRQQKVAIAPRWSKSQKDLIARWIYGDLPTKKTVRPSRKAVNAIHPPTKANGAKCLQAPLKSS